MKKFIVALFVIFLIPNIAYAQESNEEAYNSVLSQYDLSFFEDRLGNEAYSYLERLGIDDFSFNGINSIGLKPV